MTSRSSSVIPARGFAQPVFQTWVGMTLVPGLLGLALEGGPMRSPGALASSAAGLQRIDLQVGPSELDAGAVLELSPEVALVLHWLTPSLAQHPTAPSGLVGQSDALQRVRLQVQRVAAHDIAVLLLGESGTGKELAARAIHEQSPRAKGPFVSVSMASIPINLAASSLFGHRKGAFTGASDHHRGHFEAAHCGTLFLDEISRTSKSVAR